MDSGQPTEVVHVHYGCGTRRDTVRIHGYPVRLGSRLLLGESVQALPNRDDAAPLARRVPPMIGASPAFTETVARLARASRYASSVLLLGETGVGKELAARYIHDHSPRAAHPYLTIDCATLPAALAEDELFGHARGAYLGAVTTRAGLFEQANGGTVFLDEVGELTPAVQVKLLRVLESGQLRRLGEGTPKRVDVRVVCTSNRNLLAEVAAGRFRADLYYRIAGIRIGVPSLRERREDIPALAEHFLAEFRDQTGESAFLQHDALAWLQAQPFPGNLRELRQLVQRAAAQAGDGLIDAELLSSLLDGDARPAARMHAAAAPPATLPRAAGPVPQALHEVLARHGGRRAGVAAELGVSERTVYRWLHRQRAAAAR
jgi:DNA-binding NtrC family response regulator